MNNLFRVKLLLVLMSCIVLTISLVGCGNNDTNGKGVVEDFVKYANEKDYEGLNDICGGEFFVIRGSNGHASKSLRHEKEEIIKYYKERFENCSNFVLGEYKGKKTGFELDHYPSLDEGYLHEWEMEYTNSDGERITEEIHAFKHDGEWCVYK